MSIEILQGDCIESLKKLEDQSINTCITSPPYWGLRDYGVDGQLGLEETAEEFNLPYHNIPTFRSALWTHMKMLKQLGRA